MKRGIVFLVVLLGLAIVVSSVSAQPKGSLTVGVSTDLQSLDPAIEYTTAGQMMQRHFFDSLVDFSPDGKIMPRLATSWKLTDEKTWRINLRKGVKFHNGNPFTAADVKFSIEWLLDPKNKWNYRSYLASYDGMQIIDDYTADIKTKTPDPLLLNQWAAWCRVISKKFFDENGSEGLQKQAIGTGPFKFVSWKRNDSLALEANTGWYMPSPKVKTLTFRMIPEMGARVAELQAGGAQIITAVPPFIVSQLKKSDDTDVQSVPSLRAFYMILDTTKVAPLKDKRVRQALNYAVDKEAIIKAVLVGMGTPLGTHVPLKVAGAGQSIKPYPYDPQKAKALLKEAGYPDGFPLTLYSPTGRYPMDKEVTLAVADQLSKVGIKTQVNAMETSTYLKELVGHKLEGIYFMGMSSSEWDINHSLNQLTSNFVLCYYPDKTLDEMVAKTKVIMDPAKRFESALKIQNIVHEDALYLFLYNGMDSYGVSKKVKGFEARSDEMMDLWNVSMVE